MAMAGPIPDSLLLKEGSAEADVRLATQLRTLGILPGMPKSGPKLIGLD